MWGLRLTRPRLGAVSWGRVLHPLELMKNRGDSVLLEAAWFQGQRRN